MGRDPGAPHKLSRRQRKRLDQITVDERELDLEQRRLNLAIQQADHANSHLDRTEQPASVNTGDPGADQQPDRVIRGRGIVRTVALGASTLLGLVIIALQIPAYRSMLGDAATPLSWAGWLNLAILAPMAVEIVAWVYTVMAVLAVSNDRPSGRYTLAMWGFSSLAAVVNATHNMAGGQYLTGAVLGGLSIVAPFIVHSALRWDRDALDERTTDQRHQDIIDSVRRIITGAAQFGARAATGTARVGMHPLLTFKAVWVSTKYHLDYGVAFQLAATEQCKPYRDVLRDEYANAINERARHVYATDVPPAVTIEQDHATPDRATPDRDTLTPTGTPDRDTTGTLATLDRDRDTTTGTPDRDIIEQFRRELESLGDMTPDRDTGTGTGTPNHRDRDTPDRDTTGTPETPGPGHRDTPRDTRPGHPMTSTVPAGHDHTTQTGTPHRPDRDTTGEHPTSDRDRDTGTGTPGPGHRDPSRSEFRSTTGTGAPENRDRDTPIGTGTGTPTEIPDESRSESPGSGSDRDTETTREHDETLNKRQLLVLHYFELVDAGTDPMSVTFSVVGREFGADRGYVRRVFGQCRDGKHADPRVPSENT